MFVAVEGITIEAMKKGFLGKESFQTVRFEIVKEIASGILDPKNK
jgi:hypothetical protein